LAATSSFTPPRSQQPPRGGVPVLVFPELPLIGYEPDLAAELEISETDERLAPLGALADQHQMAVVVGASLRAARAKPGLAAILFAANGSTRTYAKMHPGAQRTDPLRSWRC
jgi:predicted amidohydrolase